MKTENKDLLPTTMTNPSRSKLIAHLALIAVTMIWGTTFPLVKAALTYTSPLTFNLLRMALAFAILAAINASSVRSLDTKALRFSAAAGIFLALGYQLQTAGLARTTASKSAFLTGLFVVIVPLLSLIPNVALPGSPKPRAETFLGASLAFGGLILLTTPANSGSAILSGMHLGEWLSLGCAVAFAAHLLVIARAAPLMVARQLGTLQIGFAALTMLVTLPIGGHPIFAAAPIVFWALGVTAILATAFAFTVQSWAQQQLPASHTALIFTLEPVFAWLFSLLFLGERLGPRSLAGAALILTGILFAELGPTLRAKRSILPLADA